MLAKFTNRKEPKLERTHTARVMEKILQSNFDMADRVFQNDELFATICGFLAVQDLISSASKVCKRWRHVLQLSETFWRFHPMLLAPPCPSQTDPPDYQCHALVDSTNNIAYRVKVANSICINWTTSQAAIETLNVHQLQQYCSFLSIAATHVNELDLT
jgi:hypothetical protein